MTVVAAASALDAELRALCLSVREDWLSACASDAAAPPPPELTAYAVGQVLASDLRGVAAAPALPAGIDALEKGRLPGSFVLQVDEQVDVSRRKEDRGVERAGARVLKLRLTDGFQAASAMEYERLPDLATTAEAGTKLVVRDPVVRHGMLLLSPENTRVLGGSSAAVEELRRASTAPPGAEPAAGSAARRAAQPTGAPTALGVAGPGAPGHTANGAAGAAIGTSRALTCHGGCGTSAGSAAGPLAAPPSRHPAQAVPAAAAGVGVVGERGAQPHSAQARGMGSVPAAGGGSCSRPPEAARLAAPPAQLVPTAACASGHPPAHRPSPQAAQAVPPSGGVQLGAAPGPRVHLKRVWVCPVCNATDNREEQQACAFCECERPAAPAWRQLRIAGASAPDSERHAQPPAAPAQQAQLVGARGHPPPAQYPPGEARALGGPGSGGGPGAGAAVRAAAAPWPPCASAQLPPRTEGGEQRGLAGAIAAPAHERAAGTHRDSGVPEQHGPVQPAVLSDAAGGAAGDPDAQGKAPRRKLSLARKRQATEQLGAQGEPPPSVAAPSEPTAPPQASAELSTPQELVDARGPAVAGAEPAATSAGARALELREIRWDEARPGDRYTVRVGECRVEAFGFEPLWDAARPDGEPSWEYAVRCTIVSAPAGDAATALVPVVSLPALLAPDLVRDLVHGRSAAELLAQSHSTGDDAKVARKLMRKCTRAMEGATCVIEVRAGPQLHVLTYEAARRQTTYEHS